MEQELISVIIPIFNLEHYIEKCIDSVLKQTYTNLEILLIDDGSTDNSLEICNKFKENDRRIKILTQNNKGVSSARNKGLDNAHGEYILFVDGDDYIEKNMIEKLYLNIKEYDISICNFYEVNKNLKIENSMHNTNNVIDSEEFFTNIFENDGVRGYLWNKLIRKTIIKNIRIDEELSIMEDLVFLANISRNINKVYIDKNLYLYNYVKRDESALNSLNIEKYKKIVLAYEKILKFLEGYEDLKGKYLGDYVRNLLELQYYLQKHKMNNEIYKNKIKIIKKKYLSKGLKTTYYSEFDKIKLLLMVKFPLLYFKVRELKNKIKEE